jgi:tripartite-type tricarboxylate transporter receptor subunit TctC
MAQELTTREDEMNRSHPTKCALAILAPLFLSGPAASQGVEEFYKGKTLRLIVGYSAGGGHDANARLLGRHIGKYIPGNPRVVVENMPGASSLKSVQYLDNGAPTDGTVFVAFSSGLVTESLTRPEHIPVNLKNYAWIGSLSQEVRVCYVRADLGIKDFQDMLKRPTPIVFGETGQGSASYIDANILQELFGVKLKMILGYPGGSEKKIAVERGELDGDCTSFSTVPIEWVEKGKVKIISRGSTVLLPGMPPQTPYILDLAETAEKKQLVKFLLSPAHVGRPYMASKAVPADRVAALRKAFDAAVKDPQLIAEAEKLQLPIVGSLTGDEAVAYISEMYKATPETVAAARKITQ